MKLIITLFFWTCSLVVSTAQTRPSPEQTIAEMKKLDMLAGSWEGTGWYRSQDGSIHEFNQTESIRKKLDGVVLYIEGKGRNPETDEVVHDAMGIVTYDPASEMYTMRSYLATGQFTDATAYFEGDTFIWSFEAGGGTIKYTLDITEDSEWNEVGEYSPDGSQWYQFMEMNLTKTSN